MADSQRFGGGPERAILRKYIRERKATQELKFKRLRQLVSQIKTLAAQGSLSRENTEICVAILLSDIRRRLPQVAEMARDLERDCARFLSLPEIPDDFLNLITNQTIEQKWTMDAEGESEISRDSAKSLEKLRGAILRAEGQGTVSAIQSRMLTFLCLRPTPPPTVEEVEFHQLEGHIFRRYYEIKDVKLEPTHHVLTFSLMFPVGTFRMSLKWDSESLSESLDIASSINIEIKDTKQIPYSDQRACSAFLSNLIQNRRFQPTPENIISVLDIICQVLRDPQGDDAKKRKIKFSDKNTSWREKKIFGFQEDLDFLSTRKRTEVKDLKGFDIDTLENTVRKQLITIYEKRMQTWKDIKNRNKGKKKAACDSRWPYYRIVHMEGVARKESIQEFSQVAKNIQLDYEVKSIEHSYGRREEGMPTEDSFLLPQLAFHGTSSRRNVDSIAASGLLRPGDLTATGHRITVSSGAVYGAGIYLSRDASVSESYGYHDNGVIQLFVGIAQPGAAWYCCKSTYNRRYPYVHYGQRCKAYYNSHVHAYPQIFDVTVIFKSGQFLPLFLLTVAQNDQKLTIDRTLNNPDILKLQSKAEEKKAERSVDKKQKKETKKREDIKPKALVAYRIPGIKNSWAIPISRRYIGLIYANMLLKSELQAGKKLSKAMKTATEGRMRWLNQGGTGAGINVVYMVDKSYSMGSGFRKLALPACAQIHRTLEPDWAQAVFFGKTVTTQKVDGARFFSSKSEAAKTKLEGATALTKAFRRSFELLYDRFEKKTMDRKIKLKESLTTLELAFQELSKDAVKYVSRPSGKLTPSENRFYQSLQDDIKTLEKLREEVKHLKNVGFTSYGARYKNYVSKLGIYSNRRAIRHLLGRSSSLSRKIVHKLKNWEIRMKKKEKRYARHQESRVSKEKEKKSNPKDLQTSHLDPNTVMENATTEQILAASRSVDIGMRSKSIVNRLQKLNTSLSAIGVDDDLLVDESESLNVVVVISDGVETVASRRETEAMLKSLPRLSQKMRVVVKVIAIGREADTQLMINAKLCGQTLDIFELTPIHHVPRTKNLPITVQRLCFELRANACGDPLTISTYNDNPDNSIGEGLAENLAAPTNTEMKTRLRADGASSVVIYRGENPPSKLFFNAHYSNFAINVVPEVLVKAKKKIHKSKLVTKDFKDEKYGKESKDFDEKIGTEDDTSYDNGDNDDNDVPFSKTAVIIKAITQAVTYLKMKAVARHEGLGELVDAIRKVTKAIKESGFDVARMGKLSPKERAKKMSEKRKVVQEISELTNNLRDDINLAKTMTADQMAHWLNQVKGMKYGAKALRIIENNKKPQDLKRFEPPEIARDLFTRSHRPVLPGGTPLIPPRGGGEGNEGGGSPKQTATEKMSAKKKTSFLDGATAESCWREIQDSKTLASISRKLTDLETQEKEEKKRSKTRKGRVIESGAIVKIIKAPPAKTSLVGQTAKVLHAVKGESNMWMIEPLKERKKFKIKEGWIKGVSDGSQHTPNVVSVYSNFEKKAIQRKKLQLSAELTPLDMLCAYGMVGKLIRVERCNAAVINPWVVKVSYISQDEATTSAACCALDAGLPLKDTLGLKSPDILIVADPKNPEQYLRFSGSKLHQLYQSLVFTRSIDIVLPAQRMALLTASLCKSIEQLSPPLTRSRARSRSNSPKISPRNSPGSSPRNSRSPSPRKGSRARVEELDAQEAELDLRVGSRRWNMIQNTLEILYTIRKDMTRKSKFKYWSSMIHKLKGKSPGKCLTESKDDDIASVCKPLAAMLCLDEGIRMFKRENSGKSGGMMDVDDEKDMGVVSRIKKLALALMAEASSRESRAWLKNKVPEFERLEAAMKEKERKERKDYAEKQAKERGRSNQNPDGKLFLEPEHAIIRPTDGLTGPEKVAHRVLWRALGLDDKSLPKLEATSDIKRDSKKKPTDFSCVYAEDKALKQAKRFFSSDMTNCNVRTVCAVLTFAQALEDFDWSTYGMPDDQPPLVSLTSLLESQDPSLDLWHLFDFIHQRMKTAKISKLVKSICPGVPVSLVQTALFVQGAWAHTSKTRTGGLPSLGDPRAAVEHVAQLLRQRVYEAKVQTALWQQKIVNDRLKKSSRRGRLVIEQKEFESCHEGLPRTFTVKDMDLLLKITRIRHEKDQKTLGKEKVLDENLDSKKSLAKPLKDKKDAKTGKKDKKDSKTEKKMDVYAPVCGYIPPQILMTGLLKHRCCWVSCPDYLKCFATKRDLIHGTRVGLFRHISKLFHPERKYVQGLHKVSIAAFRRHRNSKTNFVREVAEYYVKTLMEKSGSGKGRTGYSFGEASIAENGLKARAREHAGLLHDEFMRSGAAI